MLILPIPYFLLPQADTYRVGSGTVTATAVSPSGRQEDITVRKSDDNKFDIPFHPTEKGTLHDRKRREQTHRTRANSNSPFSSSGGSRISRRGATTS